MLDKLSKHLPQPLDKKILTRTMDHIKLLDYKPSSTNPHSPRIFLYGAQHYRYNKQSSQLAPVALDSAPVMEELLKSVNETLNADFNSILLTAVLVHTRMTKSYWILGHLWRLSLSGTSHTEITDIPKSLNKDKYKVAHTVDLIPRHLFNALWFPGIFLPCYSSWKKKPETA